MLGMHGLYEANLAMHDCDLMINIGARFDDRITGRIDAFSPNSKKAHVDIDPSSINKVIDVDIPIVGDVDLVLIDLLKAYQGLEKNHNKKLISPWMEKIKSWSDTNCMAYKDDGSVIKPQLVVQKLHEVTKGDAFITSDVGQHQMWAAQYYPFDKPRRWINSGGLGTMGVGLPYAMGCQLAFPESQVACVTGEASIQMCIQELSTCLQYNLPIKIININNEALGMVRQWQDMTYGGRHSASTYADSLPDFVKLAESYGHVGMKVTKQSQLRKTLDKAFAMKDRLVFVDVYVDPNEHVYPMLVAPSGSMKDMWIKKNKKA
jgi:acetolactate synthase-1/2/3 large subunit